MPSAALGALVVGQPGEGLCPALDQRPTPPRMDASRPSGEAAPRASAPRPPSCPVPPPPSCPVLRCPRWRPTRWCTRDSLGETTETWTRGSARRGGGCAGTGVFLPSRFGASTCAGAAGAAWVVRGRGARAVGAAAAGGFPPRRIGAARWACAGTGVANGVCATAPPVSPASTTTAPPAPAQREAMARPWASRLSLSRSPRSPDERDAERVLGLDQHTKAHIIATRRTERIRAGSGPDQTETHGLCQSRLSLVIRDEDGTTESLCAGDVQHVQAPRPE